MQPQPEDTSVCDGPTAAAAGEGSCTWPCCVCHTQVTPARPGNLDQPSIEKHLTCLHVHSPGQDMTAKACMLYGSTGLESEAICEQRFQECGTCSLACHMRRSALIVLSTPTARS
jgi:hypothetical protein